MLLRLPATEGEDCPYTPGEKRTVTLPGLTGRQHVRILDATRRSLALLSWADVQREVGHHRSRGDWQAQWVRRFDRGWCRRHLTASDEELCLRFRRRWARTEAWEVSFVLLEEPRCLARQEDILSGRTYRDEHGGQYVANASMSIDPECEVVDAATLVRFAAEVAARNDEMREHARQRGREARQRARNARVRMLRGRC
jgi:hypothetical protein